MARVIPDDVLHCASARLPTGLRGELEVLASLGEALPEDHCIFHSVDWHSVYRAQDEHGEIDMVAMNAAGDLLLIEVKAGPVEETDEGLFKRYGEYRKDIGRQGRRAFGAMIGRLREERLAGRLASALVLPDHRLIGPGTAAYPRNRILDADDMLDAGHMRDRLLGMLPAQPAPNPSAQTPCGGSCATSTRSRKRSTCCRAI